MYKVIEPFKDRDGKFYSVDDTYFSESEERIKTLSSSENKYGYPFIEQVKKTRKKKEVLNE